MRVFFLPRRTLAALSMLAVLVALVGSIQMLGRSEQVAAWVAAGLNDEPPIINGGQAADAFALLVAVEKDNSADEVGSLLAVLAENKARATFFIDGEFAAANENALLSIKAAGHELGVLGREQVSQEEIEKQAALLTSTTGDEPTVFMPFGGLAESGVRSAAEGCGLMFVLGSVDSGDWQADNAEPIIARLLADTEAGSFITVSPCEQSCVALSVVLPELTAKGLSCRTVSENLEAGLEDNTANVGE